LRGRCTSTLAAGRARTTGAIQLAHALAANPHTDPRDLQWLLADLETEHIALKNPNTPADFVALMHDAHCSFTRPADRRGQPGQPWMGIPISRRRRSRGSRPVGRSRAGCRPL
jgi:hypothetical protein